MARMTLTISDELKAAVEKAAGESGRSATEEAKYALAQWIRGQGTQGSNEHRATWDVARAAIATAESIPPEDMRPV